MALSRRERLLVFVALFAVVIVALSYFVWARGRVVSSLRVHRYTFCIRQIPSRPPGLNDGYLYRCEVWSSRTLIQASTHGWDSFTARSTSITTGPGSRVVFHIDSYEISCSTYGVGPVTWEER